MAEVIDLVVHSFAKNAAAKTRLIIKNHPLDTGFTNYQKQIHKLVNHLHLESRVDYLESGDLDKLLAAKQAAGLVTVNSTVGLSALSFGCPTITLSDPAYNLVGLTFQGQLDDFWQSREQPDAAFFQQFKAVLMHTTQINGGFYSSAGIALAIQNATPILTASESPLESLR